MKNIVSKIFFLLFTSFISQAQQNGDVAHFYGAYPGFDLDGEVLAIEYQNDGKLIVCGWFNSYQGLPDNYFVRLNNDGTKDMTFNQGTGFNNVVNTAAIQSDGKIVIGGYFTAYNGNSVNRLIRLNSDGTQDNTFNVGSGFNHYISSIDIQDDGKIIVGGFFSTYNGNPENRIIRLNPDGSKDISFNSGMGFTEPALNVSVRAIEIQPDGKILIGGFFNNYNQSVENYILRLNNDGTKDSSFDIGTGSNWIVNSIALQSDSKIIIGGAFTQFNGTEVGRVIRLNENGTYDDTFNTGVGFDGAVTALEIFEDGKIIIGGIFNTFDGLEQRKLICLNPDGSKNTIFNIGAGFTGNIPVGGNNFGAVRAIKRVGNESVIIGGEFVSYNGLVANHLISLDLNGTKNESFVTGNGFNGSVTEIKKQPDGKIIVVGDFTAFNCLNENRIIRINSNGTKDSSFNTGTGFNQKVHALEILSNGKVLVGGTFTQYNGTSVNRIIRLNPNGTIDPTFNSNGSGFGNAVYEIKEQSDGKILVGGHFTSYNGISQNRITRLNVDGTIDETFLSGDGFNNRVETIAIQPDNKILIGGNFSTYDGQDKNRIIRLNTNGTNDESFSTSGTGFSSVIYDIELQSDGKLLVGGDFISYNGENGRRLVRLNSNGTYDPTFNTGAGFDDDVLAVRIEEDNRILVGGMFNSFNDQEENNFICLNVDGSKNLDFLIEDGFNEQVETIEILVDGTILIGGNFITYQDSNESAYLVSLYSNFAISSSLSKQTIPIIFFPNPTKDFLNVETTFPFEKIQILDLQGKVILQSGEKRVNVSYLPTGLYFVRLIMSDRIITERVLKN